MGTFSQYQYPHTQARYAECARFCGINAKDDAEAVKKLIEKIEELKKAVGIKSSIKEYGIDEQDFLDRLDDMVEQAFDDQCTGANPPVVLQAASSHLCPAACIPHPVGFFCISYFHNGHMVKMPFAALKKY